MSAVGQDSIIIWLELKYFGRRTKVNCKHVVRAPDQQGIFDTIARLPKTLHKYSTCDITLKREQEEPLHYIDKNLRLRLTSSCSAELHGWEHNTRSPFLGRRVAPLGPRLLTIPTLD